MSLRIIFAGTPDFAWQSLHALLKTQHTLLAVLTQPDRPAGRGRQVLPSAVKQGLLTLTQHATKKQNSQPTTEAGLNHGSLETWNVPLYQPTSLKDPAIQQVLRDLNPDVLIVAAYGLILPRAVLTIPKYGCLNVHGSLLPRWRGAAPIQHAILAGDATTGITIMQMDPGMDTGDILSLDPCVIEPTDTTGTLSARLATLGADALIQALARLEHDPLMPTCQEATLATYAPKLSKQDAKLDWRQPANILARQVRAFHPWPIAYTQLGEITLRIWQAEVREPSQVSLKNVHPVDEQAIPGTLLAAHSDGIEIATGDQRLRILSLQLPGGKCLPVAELLKSRRALFQPGTVFH